jgi:microcystin-dependent protein
MDEYIGSIMLVPWAVVPKGWLPCDGRMLNTNDYQALFSLLGNYFGGDGRTSFALPDLRGRVPRGTGNGTAFGESSGSEMATVTAQTMPPHSHGLRVSTAPGTTATFGDVGLASPATTASTPTPPDIYSTGAGPMAALDTRSMNPTGYSQPHENMQPWLAMTFIICVNGHYPSKP